MALWSDVEFANRLHELVSIFMLPNEIIANIMAELPFTVRFHFSGTEDNRSDDASSVNSDIESGFADGTVVSDPIGDLGDGTVRWIAKFIDRVCSDAGLPPLEIDQLHQRIPGLCVSILLDHI